MPKFRCFGDVSGSKYLGEVEAEDESHAEDKAWCLDAGPIDLCNRCAKEVEGLEVIKVSAVLVEDDSHDNP